MTIGGELIWDWLKKAPLPVVLAINVITSFGLATGLHAVDGKASDAVTQAAVAVESKRTTERRLEAMDAKLDKLLEAVAAAKAVAEERDKTAAANRVTDKADAKAKEKK